MKDDSDTHEKRAGDSTDILYTRICISLHIYLRRPTSVSAPESSMLAYLVPLAKNSCLCPVGSGGTFEGGSATMKSVLTYPASKDIVRVCSCVKP